MPIPQLRPVRHRTVPPPERWRPARRGWHPSLKRILLIALILGLAGGIVLIAGFAYLSHSLPSPDKLFQRSVAQSTRIYARDGTTLLYEVHGAERRTVIDLKDIPTTVKQATIAVEDRDFYKHGGFKVTSIVRAILANLLHGSKVQGGSTITQQLIKNSILTNEKSYTRKLKELALANQLEKKLSKDQILKLYFNQIPYGSNAYGVEAAAETYFGKPARSLDLSESALLATLPKAPTYYSPYGNHRQELVNRYHFVLDRMMDEKYISRVQADRAKAVDILKSIQPRREAILAPHFVFYIRDLLSERYPDSEVERGGLKVVTTLDTDKQKIAEEEIAKGVAANEKKYRATNAALVSIDAKTGQVLAMVGSRDYFDAAHDGNVNVALAERNPGSSFKPFIYTTVFSRGFTPETVLFDLNTNFGLDGSGKPYTPSDYDGKERGPVTMRQALAGSLNIPAVKTLYLAGVSRVVDFANALGYTTFTKPNDYGLALALGGAGVKLLEHTAAFGTLAREGLRLPTSAILRIEDNKGRVLFEAKKPTGQQIVDKNIVRVTNSILTDNASRAYIFGAHSPLILPDRLVAAKTGTTNDWRDGWTIGFTPSLVTGVWAGNNDNSTMARGADGVFVAAPIWHAYMVRALAQTAAEKFAAPRPNSATNPALKGGLQTAETVTVDSVTHRRVPDSCKDSWPPEFISTVTIRRVHDILYYVDREKPDGPAPTNPASDPMFSRWEKSVQAWAKKNKYLVSDPPLESCSLRAAGQAPTVSFASPADGATVSGTTLNVAITVAGPQPISQVAYALDTVPVASSMAAPFGTTLDISGVTAGFHVLTATTTDSVGNNGTASVSLNFSAAAAPVLYFTEPDPGSRFVSGSTVQISGVATSPAGIASVTLFEKTGGQTKDLAQADHPGGTVTFSVPGLADGTHSLGLRLTGVGGHVTTTDLLVITIGS